MQSSATVLLERKSLPAINVSDTSKQLRLKRIGARHWRRLMRVGVPQNDAKELAIAVVRYSHLDRRPSFKQKRLIGRYCRHLCAVGLWQLELLLGQ